MGKKLLIVVDMQNDFVTGCLGTKEAQAIVPKIVDYLQNFDGDVIFTQDTHKNDYLNTQEGKNLPVEHCIEYTKGWEIVPELQKFCKCTIKKNTFGSIALAEEIRLADNDAYDEIQLCGVCTGICVISNALLLKANKPETPITVLKDLCACVTPESHETALKAMELCQINIK